MAPEEETSHSEAPRPHTSGEKAPVRRGRRSGRGRRGHGRRGRPTREPEHTSTVPPAEGAVRGEEAEPIFELASERPETADSELPVVEPSETAREPFAVVPAPAAPVEPQSASPESIHNAIEEVNSIVDALRGALDEMEEVLEMLELFERQKNADEREIESLRRALRQMHRPRDAGHQR